MKRTRSLFALLPVAILAASLTTACTAGNSSTAAGNRATEDCIASGEASESLEITGDLGSSELTLETTPPISSTTLERSVLIEGDGDAIVADDTVTTQLSYFNGTTGELLSSNEAPLENTDGVVPDWALNMVKCSVVGDRVAAVVPVADILGEGNAEANGLAETDSLVLVLDLLSVTKPCEDLTARDEKYPEVDLGDGTTEPVITIPSCMEPPTELELDVLVEGDGDVVKEGDAVMTNYVGVDWDGAVRFDGSWTETGTSFSTAEGALIDGFRQAMIGQKIGSTILVTMPPELGYDDGMTRTFVLQLVSIAESE